MRPDGAEPVRHHGQGGGERQRGLGRRGPGVRRRDNPHALRPAKGVHVTVPAERMPCDIAAVIPVPKDKRSIFVVSWPEGGLVYLGTTDTEYEGPFDDPACTPDDVDYLLDAVNNVTTAELTRADITGVWAGLRPVAGPTRRRPPCLRAHLGSLTAPHGGDLQARRGDGDRRQAHDLPQDGPGHGRCRGGATGPPVRARAAV